LPFALDPWDWVAGALADGCGVVVTVPVALGVPALCRVVPAELGVLSVVPVAAPV
jgi:hypothetical protein